MTSEKVGTTRCKLCEAIHGVYETVDPNFGREGIYRVECPHTQRVYVVSREDITMEGL
jgi:hypothetical protein